MTDEKKKEGRFYVAAVPLTTEEIIVDNTTQEQMKVIDGVVRILNTLEKLDKKL